MSRARDIADLSSVSARLDTLGASEGALSNRNLIINGAMQVAQRGTQTNSTNAYTACDRWEFIEGGSSVITSSQDSDSPQGFANSVKLDVTTASGTPSSADYAILRTKFEGQDLQNLQYGTSSAKPLTLSFWVKSAKTGTHYVEAVHTDASYYTNSIVYTINSADTWEQKSITFSGYQTTGFDNDNANSFQIYFWLMTGSDYGGGTHTTNTWHNTTANRVVGQVNVMDSTSNNFYVTGVQLEIGEKATAFEHEPYERTLSKCLRYYQKHVGWITQFNRGLDSNYDAHVVNNGVGVVGFMRATPTETIDNVYRWDAGDSDWTSDSTAFSAAISSSSQTFVEGYYGRQSCNAVKADWELIAEL